MEYTTYGSYQTTQLPPGYTTGLLIFYAVMFVLAIVIDWKLFTKADKPGWAAIIPIYNVWVLYEIICDRGTAMFRLLIPIYNIYWVIKSMIKLAHAYGKSTGFGVGLLFLPIIFRAILAFGSAEYEGPQDM